MSDVKEMHVRSLCVHFLEVLRFFMTHGTITNNTTVTFGEDNFSLKLRELHALNILPRVGVPGRERLLLAAEAFTLWFILDRLELFFPCSTCCSAPRQSRTSSTHNGEEEYGTDAP